MKKSELIKLVEGVSDEQDINSLLVDTDVVDTFKEKLNVDMFKDKVKTDKEFKNYVNSINDNYFNTALDTWKKNNLEKELEPFIQAKYPDLVTDPLQKKILELEKKNADIEAKSARKDLLTEAIKYASDKKLPASVIEKCLAEDFDKTKEVIDTIATDWTKGIETITTEKMKSNSYVPGKGSDGSTLSIGASIAAALNQTNSAPSDPWASK